MQVVREPAADAALAFLRTEVVRLNEGRGHLVQALAECEVRYQGRATSTLQRGERLVLLKPDGTLLVHTGASAKPVNWQPPGALFDARLEDDRVVLTAYRRRPEELVHITFHAIRLLVAAPLRDDAELALVGSEDDLQRLLFENPDFVEPGFRPRRRERGSRRGFTDLDGDDAGGRRLVVEVKRAAAGVKDAQQLWRYVERLRGEAGGVAQQRVAGAAPGARRAGGARNRAGKGARSPRTVGAGGEQTTEKAGGQETAQQSGGEETAQQAGGSEATDRSGGGRSGHASDGTKRVRGMLIAPRVADKARALLRDHDLEWKELDWAEVLPRVEAMRHAGQVGLGRFG